MVGRRAPACKRTASVGYTPSAAFPIPVGTSCHAGRNRLRAPTGARPGESGNKVLLRPHGGTPLRSPGAEVSVGRTAGQASDWVNADVLKALRGELPNHIANQEAVPRWLERFGVKAAL